MKVAVTTSPDAYSRYADALIRSGFTPVPIPCISVAAARAEVVDQARRVAAEADCLLLTSARAVGIVWGRGGPMPRIPAVAVGPATAAAVRTAGGVVAVEGAGGGHEALDSATDLLSGRVVAYPHAAGADPTIAARLASLASTVHAAAVYETRTRVPSPEPVDAAVFASPSAVDGWLSGRPMAGLVVAAIGKTTADHIRAIAGREPLVAATPTPDALADALSAAVADLPTERNPV